MSFLSPHFRFWGILLITALFYGSFVGIDIQRPLLDLGLIVLLAHLGQARRDFTSGHAGWLLASVT